LEALHSLGYLHLDIKPDNILIKGDCANVNPRSNLLYLIDFGISKSFYKKNTKEHVEKKENVMFAGNLVFASKNAFNEISMLNHFN
jgi:serine/threonine protein kinase